MELPSKKDLSELMQLIQGLKENNTGLMQAFEKLVLRYEKITEMLGEFHELLKVHQEAINALHRENQLLREELTQPNETGATTGSAERNVNED